MTARSVGSENSRGQDAGRPEGGQQLKERNQKTNPTSQPTNKTMDYIPAQLALFAVWLQNFATRVAAAPTDFGLTAADAAAITAQNDNFQAAYLESSSPATRTSATVATTAGARIAAQSVVRPYAMRINANQSVSDAQRTDMGITVRTVVPTPIPPPTTSPALIFVAATPGRHELQVRDSTTPATKAKPAGVIGLELWVATGLVAAIDPSSGVFRQVTTKSPFGVQFVAGDKGKVATYFARWLNRSGTSGIAANGPWSAPLSAIVI